MTRSVEAFTEAQQKLLQRYGVEAASRFIDVPSVTGKVHVLTCGAGPPVVMVPGFGDPAAMWTPLMANLAGFTVYAVDRPCFGLTGHARYTTETFRRLAVEFLEQVLDALGLDRPVIVGNSIGSLWSLWLALARPNRVAAMVHIGCPAFILGTSAPLPMRLLSVRPLGRLAMKLSRPSSGQVERFGRLVGEDLSDAPEVRDLLVAAQELPGVQTAVLDLLHAVVTPRGARREVSMGPDELARIPQPALLIWGGRDPFGSVDVGEDAARLMPNAALHVIAQGGHVPWVTRPGAVADAALPFLRGEGPRP